MSGATVPCTQTMSPWNKNDAVYESLAGQWFAAVKKARRYDVLVRT